MNVKIEIVNENMAVVTAEIDAKKVDEAIDGAVNAVFKKENADKEASGADKEKMLTERKEEIYGVATEMLAKDAHYNAVTMNRIQPVSYPKIEVKGELEAGKDAVIVITFDIVPKLHLGKYVGIEVKKQEISVTNDEVNSLVKSELYAKKQIIAKTTPAENGDTVVIDFEGFCDGVAFDGGKAEKYSLKLGSGTFIPGFEEQLIGTSAGEETEVNVKFPEAYTPELAGKDAVFKIKVHAVQEERIPSLDDITVKEISGGACQTVAEYFELKKNELTKKKEDEAENEIAGELFNKICQDSYANIPDSMVEGALEADIKNLENQAKAYGTDVDTLLMYMGAPSLEIYKEKKREYIKNEIIFSLAIEAIAQAEGLIPTPKEIDDEYTAEAERMNDERTVEERVQELKSKHHPSSVASYLMGKRVLDFVRSKAIIK